MSVENINGAEAGNLVSRSLDKVARNAHEAIDKAQDAACSPSSTLASGAHQMTDSIAETARQVAANVSLGGAQWRLCTSRATENWRARVCARPLSSLGLAVGIGIAIGWLSGQIHRHH